MTDTNRTLTSNPDGRAFGARAGGGVLDYFVRHKTAANLLLVVMLVAGSAAALQIRAQFFPDVVLERISVSVPWVGAGAEDVDDGIVSRIEPALRGVDGVEEIDATSREGRANISVEFVPGWDMARALDEVKAAVDEVNDLPDGIEDPVIKRASFSDRVTDVVVTGNVPLELLDQYTNELKSRLFREGVSKTSIRGLSDPVIRINTTRKQLEQYDLSIQDISAAIASETGTVAIGEMNAGAARVTADSSRSTVQEIGSIAVRTRSDGTRLLVRDVAQLREEGLARGAAKFHGDNPAVILRVDRDAQGDALNIQATVQRVVDEMAQTLPGGVTMRLAHARAKAIGDRIDLLAKNGLLGLAIVLVLLFLFLSARTAFWVAAGIPVAVAATIGLMYAFGLTINMVSLFALIISLGIIVDDAIVVGEHADHLHANGMTPTQAATGAAKRMAAPVLAASVTTVTAFASLTFIEGRFGSLIADMPFTVGVVVIASLVECFLILPAHMRHSLSSASKESWFDAPSRWVNRGFNAFKARVFKPLIRFCVAVRYPLFAAVVALLMFSVAALVDRTVRWQFFSAPERGTLRANVSMLPGASRTDTREMLKEMDRAMNVVAGRLEAEHGVSPLVMMLSTVGATVGRGLRGAASKDPDLIGGVEIELIDPDERPYSAYDVLDAWQQEINKPPLLDQLALRRGRSGPGGDDIDVRMAGPDSRTLKAAAEALKTELGRFSQVSALEDTLVYDKPEYAIKLTPRGESLGFTTRGVALQLRQQLAGTVARTIVRDSRDIEIDVRLPDEEVGASYLYDAKLPLPGGQGYVPLTTVATVTEKQSFSTIVRKAGERIVTVSGELSEDAAEVEEVRTAITARIMPDIASQFGVTWTSGGLAEQEKNFLEDALSGFGLCLISIYLVLAWVFGSWVRPLTIMLVIPLGLIGAIWGHYFHGVPLSMFSVVGLIGMAGIIINDSIVLITTIDQRAKTQSIKQAVIDGASDRLRAVLLTTLTTVGGLTPLLFEQSRQAVFLKPTVITLSWGLGFGVVLVMLVTPALVMMQHDIGARITSARRMLKFVFSGRTYGRNSRASSSADRVEPSITS